MGNKHKFSSLVAVALIWTSCTSGDVNGSSPLTAQAQWEHINLKKAELVNDESREMDTAAAQEMLQLLQAYIDSFPNDTLVPEALFYAGDVAQGLGDYWGGVKFLNRLYRTYPESKRAPEAVLLQAFILDEHLNQKNLAAKSYEDFIERFPNHARAREVRGMMLLLNEGEEAFIKRIEKDNP
jgi:TolA-binding protein